MRAGLSSNGSFGAGNAAADGGGMSASGPGTAGAAGAADGSPSSELLSYVCRLVVVLYAELRWKICEDTEHVMVSSVRI